MTTVPRRAAPPVSAPTILVVESEVLIRMPLAEYLRDCGYRAVEAANVAEAKAVLNAGTPVDLVFTNVSLASGQSGFLLANWVRQHHPKTKVLLASSIANAAEKAGDLCANGPMSAKPYQHEVLLRRIQALLHLARRTGSDRGKDQRGMAVAG